MLELAEERDAVRPSNLHASSHRLVLHPVCEGMVAEWKIICRKDAFGLSMLGNEHKAAVAQIRQQYPILHLICLL